MIKLLIQRKWKANILFSMSFLLIKWTINERRWIEKDIQVKPTNLQN